MAVAFRLGHELAIDDYAVFLPLHPQLVLQDLAGGNSWQRIHEFNILGCFEMGYILSCPLDELFFGEFGTIFAGSHCEGSFRIPWW